MYTRHKSGQMRQDLQKELGAAYDLVVCSGGDGTLSEVLDGVMTIDEKKTSKDWLHSGRLN